MQKSIVSLQIELSFVQLNVLSGYLAAKKEHVPSLVLHQRWMNHEPVTITMS